MKTRSCKTNIQFEIVYNRFTNGWICNSVSIIGLPMAGFATVYLIIGLTMVRFTTVYL